MRRWCSPALSQCCKTLQITAAMNAPTDRQINTKQQSDSDILAYSARKGMRGPMIPLTIPLMKKEKVQTKRYSQFFHILQSTIMLKDLKKLFGVPDFYLHFCITSLITIIVPNFIYKLIPPHSVEQRLHPQMWFLNFDGIHYFNNHYEYQPNHAFLPLYVKLVQGLITLVGQTAAIAFLIVINKFAFLVAAADLRVILRKIFEKCYSGVPQTPSMIQHNPRIMVKFGLLFFLYNPAGIFFNVIYTEALFCLLTFKAVRILLKRKRRSLVTSTSLMTLSVGLRSNGMFLAPVIGLEVLFDFARNLTKDFILSLKTFLKGIAIILSLLTPFIIHNVFTYLNLCHWGNHQSDMCQKGPLTFYGAVQERYWNVGFLKYFTPGNALFIIIGTPAIIVGFIGLFYFEKSFDLRQKGLYLSFVILFLITTFFTNIQSSTRFFCSHPYFYYVMARLSTKLGLVKVWAVFYWMVGMFMYVVAFPWT